MTPHRDQEVRELMWGLDPPDLSIWMKNPRVIFLKLVENPEKCLLIT